MIALRNRLIHGYDTINYDAVWLVTTNFVPPIIPLLEAALEAWPSDPP
ncbi:hypothetical protein BH11PLA1_BH11PLA1_07530 [soil metagenome]